MKRYIFTDKELIQICKLANSGQMSAAYEAYNDLPTGANLDTPDFINFIESFLRQFYFYREHS